MIGFRQLLHSNEPTNFKTDRGWCYNSLHDVQPLPHPTPEALDIIIPEQDQGYEFVTLSDLF